MKVGIDAYQLIALFMGWGRPSRNIIFLKGHLAIYLTLFSIGIGQQKYIVFSF